MNLKHSQLVKQKINNQQFPYILLLLFFIFYGPSPSNPGSWGTRKPRTAKLPIQVTLKGLSNACRNKILSFSLSGEL